MLVDARGVAQAINSGAIVPNFQPLIELRSGSLAGFEVLARWQHPEQGDVLPPNFISIAEQTGLILPLTHQLLRKSLAAVANLPRQLTLSINISPTQLHDLTLPQQIQQIAEETGFDLTRLIIEITETALVDDIATAQSIAAGLKSLGCRLALDDFGTGYSSLQHLHALPFDEIKVDRSFVRTMNSRPQSRKIAAAVVGLGHSLGLTTVAEGIELKEQAEMMLALGCDLGQGWLFGKPVAAEFLPLLAAAPPHKTMVDPIIANTEWVVNSLESMPTQRYAQLQAIYNAAPVGLCFLDRNLRYVSLNRRLAEMNNMPMAAHIGSYVGDVIPQIFPYLEPFMRRALAGESIKNVEVTKPPTEECHPGRTLLIAYQPAFDEAGEIIGISVVILDITERKKAEDALQEINEHYRHMVELSPHIPWILNPDGNLVDYSTRWEKLTGLTKEKTINWGWINGLHPEDRQRTIDMLRQHLASGLPIDFEYRVGTMDGQWRWMRTRGVPLFDDNGKIVRWYGTLEDIEDQKRTMDLLQKSQGRLQAIFEAAPVCILIADAPDGTLTMANSMARQFLPQLALPGPKISNYRDWWVAKRLDGSELKNEEYPLARAVLHGESTSDRELVILPVGGHETPMHVSAAPICGSHQEILGGVLVFQPPEEFKRARFGFQQLMDDLREALVGSRIGGER